MNKYLLCTSNEDSTAPHSSAAHHASLLIAVVDAMP